MISRLVITFLPRSKQASLNIMAAITVCTGAINKMPQYINELLYVILHESMQYVSGETKVITDICKERS